MQTDLERLQAEISRLMAALEDVNFECQRLEIVNKNLDFQLKEANREPRVKPFADAVHSLYIYDAHKPSTKNYEKAMEQMHTEKGNTIFIGDQMFTDVFGANRTGIPSIMVKKIHWKEEIQIVLKRRLEAIVLIGYRRYRKTHKSILE